METIKHLFFDCRFAQAVWGLIFFAFGIPNPSSTTNMFGSWMSGLNKNQRSLSFLGAAATVWSLWLNRNDIVFEKKRSSSPLQVIYTTIHWLRTWAALQKEDQRTTLMEATQCLAQVAKAFFTQAHGWRSSLQIDSH